MNRHNYELRNIVEDLLFFLTCDDYSDQMWSLCTCRKEHKCVVTDDIISKGDICYRPTTNGNNRYHRISEDGMKELIIIWRLSK